MEVFATPDTPKHLPLIILLGEKQMSKPLVVAAHQPNFMPYLGFFDKMNQCDIFVIRDECLYVKDDYHRRNRIRINGQNNETNPQFAWLSVPAIDSHDYIKHIQIKDGPVS